MVSLAEEGVYTSGLWEGLVWGGYNSRSLEWDGRIADLLIHYFSGVGLVEEVPVAECKIAEQFLGL